MEPNNSTEDKNQTQPELGPQTPSQPNQIPQSAPVVSAVVAASPLQQPVSAPADHHKSNASTIILEWLTYALWGWTVLVLSILVSIVLSSFINGNDESFTAYAAAAVLVLLPISVACDYFFTKQEQLKKVGAEMLIMVVHAVLFALFGIGALITAAVSVFLILTSSSDTKGNRVALFSALIIFIIYLAVLLRTLNPAKFPWIRRAFTIFMLLSVGLICILAIVGPVNKARLAKDDTLIENNLSSLNNGIENYSQTNKKLPDSLAALQLQGDDLVLRDKNLIRYTANTKAATVDYGLGNTSIGKINTINTTSSPKTFYYTLCATYKKANQDSYGVYNTNLESDGYTTYIETYNHPAGEVCYKIKHTINSY